MKAAICACALILVVVAAAAEQAGLKSLYGQHRWFELRDAIQGQNAPPLYKGAVASAFNDTKAAEKYLNEVIGLSPNSATASDARDMLVDLYSRTGRYRDALRELDQSLTITPGRADLSNAHALFAAWSKHPDQAVDSTRPNQFHGSATRDGVILPVSIHGKTAHWALDTGANFSIMSEAEAAMFGVAVDESSARVSDQAGGATKISAAVVDELSIGDARFRNVAFLVIADSQEPMKDLSPGERGLIGIQIPVGLRSISWKSDGTFQTGPKTAHAKDLETNLCFDGLLPVTRVQFQGKPLDFVLDSGEGAGSQLWTRFADDFAALLKERGTKAKHQVTEVGGSHERDTIELPEIQLRLGGLRTTLRPARVFAKPVGDDFHHGHLGLDALSQAREVRLDFASMSLELLP